MMIGVIGSWDGCTDRVGLSSPAASAETPAAEDSEARGRPRLRGCFRERGREKRSACPCSWDTGWEGGTACLDVDACRGPSGLDAPPTRPIFGTCEVGRSRRERYERSAPSMREGSETQERKKEVPAICTGHRDAAFRARTARQSLVEEMTKYPKPENGRVETHVVRVAVTGTDPYCDDGNIIPSLVGCGDGARMGGRATAADMGGTTVGGPEKDDLRPAGIGFGRCGALEAAPIGAGKDPTGVGRQLVHGAGLGVGRARPGPADMRR